MIANVNLFILLIVCFAQSQLSFQDIFNNSSIVKNTKEVAFTEKSIISFSTSLQSVKSNKLHPSFKIVNSFLNDTSNQKTHKRSVEDTNTNAFTKEEIGWSQINEEVDIVIPLVLEHLQELGIEYMQLPDMKERISINPIFITYEAGIFLTNGIVYNIAGIERYGDSYMTYFNKSFQCRFYLILKTLQFEYNFLIKVMALEGYGKVIGSLDDTIIYSELAVNLTNMKLKLDDFRIIKFGNIHVQLDQIHIIRQLTGVILSPITNLFKDRITTSISDGLKDQMQVVMDDFNDKDPLQLRQFTKKLLSSLIGLSP